MSFREAFDAGRNAYRNAESSAAAKGRALRPFKRALDEGGPARVKLIAISFILGLLILIALPGRFGDLWFGRVGGFLWILFHVLWALRRRNDKREEETARESAAQDSLVVSDSLTAD